MRVFAISDLHLSHDGRKPMDVFGDHWVEHAATIAARWRETVAPEDLVLLPGDLSWAMKPADAAPDLALVGALPGVKVLLKGNHDYWWASAGKARKAMPDGMHILQNDAFTLGGVTVGGARGWVDPRLDFSGFPGHAEMGAEEAAIQGAEEDRRHYERELGRLELSLAKLDPSAAVRIALCHFPPTSWRMEQTEVTKLLARYRVDHVIFGHLHRSAPSDFTNPFGVLGQATYHLVSADYIDFRPLRIL